MEEVSGMGCVLWPGQQARGFSGVSLQRVSEVVTKHEVAG